MPPSGLTDDMPQGGLTVSLPREVDLRPACHKVVLPRSSRKVVLQMLTKPMLGVRERAAKLRSTEKTDEKCPAFHPFCGSNCLEVDVTDQQKLRDTLATSTRPQDALHAT